MASYSISANNVSQTTPKLARGTVTISSDVTVYWTVGESPTATDRCALLSAGDSKTLRLPVSCSKIAVLAVNIPGTVNITEINGTKASCSA